jgi:hypothetical protein
MGQPGFGVRDRHQNGRGNAVPRDRDFLASGNPIQQGRQMGFRFECPYSLHVNPVQPA